MANPDRALIPRDPLAVGATRPPVVKGFNVQRVYLVPIIGLPMLLVIGTRNPLWLLLIFPLTVAARSLAGYDPNQPRILWLAYKAGTLFGRRDEFGKGSLDPHLTVRMPLNRRR